MIDIISNELRKKTKLHLVESINDTCILKLFLEDNDSFISSENDDFFSCFGDLRKQVPGIKFLCKGAKVNVFPSRMARQMSRGRVAYECVMGRSATTSDIVHIFDFDDRDIANSPEEQIEFYNKWLMSFRTKK
ncbi:hypothetical protein F6H50_23865 [Salmonella enterica subsp. enterica serovar Agona]|nr:hypothetical protein [Salmonella enterica]ECX3649389.1 hypothetical protein [Salmonella enterica subsp. enterica serovar Agona]EGY1691328.1 hypothetical protein [Salmonella enterica subsp. enterica serovar Agona]